MTILKAWVAPGAILFAAAGLGIASAQPAPATGRADLVQKLADCRKVPDDTARLACYDQAAAAFDQAEAKGDIVVVDREQARTVRRQAFGFSLPSIALFERGESQEEVSNVTGKVASARMNGAGKWVVELEDGATWVQIDSNELFRYPKPGMEVRIRRASLGSYLMSVDGQRSFRASRAE